LTGYRQNYFPIMRLRVATNLRGRQLAYAVLLTTAHFILTAKVGLSA